MIDKVNWNDICLSNMIDFVNSLLCDDDRNNIKGGLYSCLWIMLMVVDQSLIVILEDTWISLRTCDRCELNLDIKKMAWI